MEVVSIVGRNVPLLLLCEFGMVLLLVAGDLTLLRCDGYVFLRRRVLGSKELVVVGFC